jgi:hypothetical protein
MAQWLNPETGEMEEKPDTGTNAFSTQGATSAGPGLPEVQPKSLQSLYQNPTGGLGDLTYTPGEWPTVGNIGEDGSTSAGGDGPRWMQRGDYRIQEGTGDYYQKLTDGKWNPYLPDGYDARMGNGNVIGSNERLSFVDAFKSAPTGYGTTGTELQNLAVASGWHEPDRSGGGGGLFGNDILNWIGQAAASYFGGPIGAGIYSMANTGGDIGKSLMAAGMTYAGGEMGGVGSGAEGGSWYSPAGDLSKLFSEASPWTVDPTTGLNVLSGDVAAQSGLEGLFGNDGFYSSLANGSEPTLLNSVASEAPTSVTNMEQGFRDLSQNLNPTGWNTSALNPDVSSLSNTGSTAFRDYGIETPNTTPYTRDYGTPADAQNAVDYGTSGADTPNGMDTLGSTNKFQSYVNTIKNGGMSMKDMLTNPIGGKMNNGGILSKLFKAPTPLEMGVRGLGAFDSWNQGKKAQDTMREQMSRMSGAEDNNAARGSAANGMWTENFRNPRAGYDEFMRGAGRDAVNTMRATAAKSGNRGSYLNSGRYNSDLESMFLKNQNARGNALSQGFSTNPYQASSSMAPGLAGMIKNQNAPLFQGASGIMQGFKLADLFGED